MSKVTNQRSTVVLTLL